VSRRLLPIFLIVLVDIFGLTLIIPLLSIYAEKFDASALQATLLVSVFAVCQLFSGPLLGQISDRVGRKPLLIVSQIGTLIGFVILAKATALWMLYLSRIIDGSTAGNISLAQAYISDNTAPKDRAKSFAVIGIAFGVGFFLGPFLTGYLVHYGFTAPIWAAAGLSATSILCTTFLLPGGPPPKKQHDPGDLPGGKRLGVLSWGAYAQYFKRPVLAGLLVQFFFYVFCFSTFTSGFALFAERTFHWQGHAFGPREIGFLFGYVGFLGIILQGGLIGRLVKRFGEPALVHVGFATLVVSYLALGLIHGIGWLVVVSTISSFGNGVLRPTLSSLVSQNAGAHEQGVVIGLNQSLSSVASIFAPIVAGFFIDRSMLMSWAWVAAVAALLGLLLAKRGSALAPRHAVEGPMSR
jgi:DHA1 family tetracycline resistance protein-like MFS transporter